MQSNTGSQLISLCSVVFFLLLALLNPPVQYHKLYTNSKTAYSVLPTLLSLPLL